MSSPRIVISNDDGIGAEGLHALTRAIGRAGLPAVVVAPAQNESGVSRLATYGRPVSVEHVSEVEGIQHYACHGTPIDCVRTALLGDVAPKAELVVSGINHGPNLGDDMLNSGTVAAASEGALLGAGGLALSQQYFDHHFHILDAFDQATPVYDATADVGALFTAAMLDNPGPNRAFLNVNVPANIRDGRIAITRRGRRYYDRGGVPRVERDGVSGYLTFGERDGPPPRFEDDEGTDFGALRQFRVSVTPVSYAWHEARAFEVARDWAGLICSIVEPKLSKQLADGP